MYLCTHESFTQYVMHNIFWYIYKQNPSRSATHFTDAHEHNTILYTRFPCSLWFWFRFFFVLLVHLLVRILVHNELLTPNGEHWINDSLLTLGLKAVWVCMLRVWYVVWCYVVIFVCVCLWFLWFVGGVKCFVSYQQKTLVWFFLWCWRFFSLSSVWHFVEGFNWRHKYGTYAAKPLRREFNQQNRPAARLSTQTHTHTERMNKQRKYVT